MTQQRYIAALGYRWLNRLYDPLCRLTMPERRFKSRLIELARIEPRMRVLDVGCGTGTLMLLLQRTQPAADVVGADGDFSILEIARSKSIRRNSAARLTQAMAWALPFPDATFDRVLTTLVLHHLTREHKQRTLREVRRVLRPGGELHIADWGVPANRGMQAASLLVGALDTRATVADNLQGLLPELCREAGFPVVRESDSFNTLFGTLSILSAASPG